MKKAPEKIVYFVRHGQSEGNISPVFQSTESSLSEEGKKQAGLIAERISKIDFDVLIASPLNRTQQTAEAITAITGKIAEYSDFFVERKKPTNLSGKPYDDENAQALAKEWEKSLYTSDIRADEALKFLSQRAEKSIVVVTHGFFLRTIVARVMLGDALTPEAFGHFQYHTEMENTGLTVMEYQQRRDGLDWRLWIYNDHAHLG